LGGRAFFSVLLIAASLLAAYVFLADDAERAAPAKPVAQITNTLQKSPSAGSSGAIEPAKTTAVPGSTSMNAAAPVGEPLTLSKPEVAIILPISDVSLNVQPELLQHLVAICRLRLTREPNDSNAMATLSQLREHALAELDVISATDSPALAANSLELTARLFPELADNSRYRSIAARINTGAKDIAQRMAPATSDPVAAIPQTTSPTAPAATPALVTATPAVSTPPTPSSLSQNQSVAAMASRKPQIRVNSLTPGVIKKDRFVPQNGGNIFRLNIGYRYRDERLDNQPGSGLIAQLSKSGSSKVLAEVPVEVTGSKGEKSFLIGTFEKADMGKFYKLNFTVDGHVLPSHTVQLMPANFAGL
jgi:hypothetical protein